MISFTITIPEEKQNKDLLSELKQELSGVLNWALDGCLMWQDEGLGYPDEIREATKSYRFEMDNVGSFLQDYCILADNDRLNILNDNFSKFDLSDKSIPFAKSSILYDKWVQVTGNKHVSQTLFSRKLSERGYYKRHFKDGQYWIGIGILEDHS